MGQHQIFLDALSNVAKLCAVAAMTAPKSGGQLFLKVVSHKNIIFDKKMPDVTFE